jgi:hypothetical protein
MAVACAVAGTVQGADREPAASRPWPLSGEVNLTSSFGEYRSGHLHAGLDIKTYGREGLPCRAVGDGQVTRMRAAPDGYGKALYVKLATGETAVYAHLAEFSPDLEDLLYQEQLSAGRYRVDVHFAAGRFPVKSGDVIGYTGSTGASAPHLHFEVRDSSENPINPLSSGWGLSDGVPPEIRAVTLFPLTRGSRVDAVCRPRNLALRRVSAGRYVAADTLLIEGRVGLGAHVVDRLNSSSGRLAPYRVELVVEGVLLSSIAFESFGYAHAGEVELAYDMERVRGDGEEYLLLFRRDGETLWNRTFIDDGVIDAEALRASAENRKDVYTAVVSTVDVAGNVTAALVPFRVDGAPGAAAPSRERMGELAGCYVFEDLLSLTPEQVKVALPEGFHETTRTVFAVDEFGENSGGAGPVTVVTGGITAYFMAARRGERATHAFPTLGIDVTMGENSLYSDAFIFVAEGKGKAAANGLSPAAPQVRVGPLSLALRNAIRIRRAGLQGVDPRVSFYRLDEPKKRWSYQPSLLEGDTLVVDVDRPGTYGAFIDRDPPVILPGQMRTRRSYATGDVVREIVISIEDAGSGVDDGRTVIYLNDDAQIARWDGYANKMYVQLRGGVTEDPIEVSVVAYDKVGNESRGQTEIALSRAEGK